MRKSNAQIMKAKDAVTRKCGLYGRVSTLRQAKVEEGGLDTQFSCMEKTVDFENEKAIGETWEIVDRYREEGRSGKDLERPEFKRLMADVQSGRIAAIDIHQEAEDPSSGHMNIMLFEEELPGWKPHLTQLNGAQEKTLTFQPLTGWNCERVERLLD
ncbi:hypothetical protein GC163_21100 [bacterium]|nr:hypothetical protein [bacterium]